MKKIRDSRFELLRIISMIFIVISHYSLWGNWDEKVRYKYLLFQPLGQIGVCVFVLISGYFLSNRTLNFLDGWKRAKKLWIRTIIYSWVIFVSAIVILGFKKFTIIKILTAIFPVIFGEYWFITEFIVLILFVPLLNQILATQNRTELKYYISIIVFLSSILPLFVKSLRPLGDMDSAAILVSVYLIAGYFKKYDIKMRLDLSLILFVGGIIVELFSIFILREHEKQVIHFTYGIIPMISAIGLFNGVLYLKNFHNKFINYIASSVLAAYLITENPFVRMWLWNNLLDVSKFQNYNYFVFVLYGIIISCILIIICCLIDKIYETIESLFL